MLAYPFVNLDLLVSVCKPSLVSRYRKKYLPAIDELSCAWCETFLG